MWTRDHVLALEGEIRRVAAEEDMIRGGTITMHGLESGEQQARREARWTARAEVLKAIRLALIELRRPESY